MRVECALHHPLGCQRRIARPDERPHQRFHLPVQRAEAALTHAVVTDRHFVVIAPRHPLTLPPRSYMASSTHPRRQPLARAVAHPLGAFRVAATPLARATIWSLGFYGVTQGVMILALGGLRFGGPSFEVLRTVPGGHVAWGITAVTLGFLILIASATHHFTVKAIGLLGLASWSMCFAVGIALAALKNPGAGTTGIPTYMVLAVCAAILVWVDERKTFHP